MLPSGSGHPQVNLGESGGTSIRRVLLGQMLGYRGHRLVPRQVRFRHRRGRFQPIGNRVFRKNATPVPALSQESHRACSFLQLLIAKLLEVLLGDLERCEVSSGRTEQPSPLLPSIDDRLKYPVSLEIIV